jgi:putative ABC transport system permease protein
MSRRHRGGRNLRSPARLRALARIAWRDARRHRGRSLLVLAMVALPIAALTVGVVFFSVANPTTEQQAADVLGDADITIVGDDPAALRRAAGDLPSDSTITVRTTVTTTSVVDGRRHTVLVDDVLPDDPLLAPRYDLLDGRPPERSGETVVAPAVLDDFGVGIGDEIAFDAPDLRLLVTGTVVRPERLAEPTALVPPGALDGVPGAAVSGLFVDLPGGVDAADLPVDDTLHSVVRADLGDPFADRSAAVGSMFGLAALGLAETGLVVVAAFVIGTDRRLRRAGLVAAIGGEPRHARTMVLLEGVVLGLAGAIIGVGLGLATTRLSAARLDQVVGRVTAGTPLPWPMLAGAIVLGTAAATIAVLGQARLAGRVGVVDALAGRVPPPTPPGRVARRGALVALVGAGIIAAGTGRGNEGIQVAGIGTMVAGILMAVPLLVAAVGRAATRLPLPLRLAARDTARHGRRAGAAVAGATLALALPVTVATITLAEDARTRAEPPLATDHVLVSGGTRASMADVPVIDDAVRATTDVDAAATLTRATFARHGGAGRAAPGPALVHAGPPPADAAAQALGTLTVGDADLLRALHAEERIADLRAGAVVVIGEDVVDGGTVHVAPATDGAGAPVDLRAVASDGPTYPSLPQFVISPRAAQRAGLTADARGPLLYRAASPVGTETLDEIRAAIATIDDVWVLGAADTFVDSGSFQALMMAVTVPIALATLGVSTAMVVAESRRDQAVLAAVGAAPGTRRRMVGSAALLLGLLAAALAIPAGYVPVTLMLRFSEAAYPVVVPWLTMAGALGAALLAGLGGLLLSREPPAAGLIRGAG